jgi:hypothetical protein
MANIDIDLANGQKAGETLKALRFQAAALNKEISTLKPGTEGFAKASESLNQVKDKMKGIQDQVSSTVSASDMLKASWNKMPFSSTLNDAFKSLSMMQSGVGGLISKMGVLKVAIASTGIGLLVVALGALYTWFTKTEEGADTLKKVLYPLQVLFENIKGVVAELGGKIFAGLKAAFENPVQAIKDLGAALWENIINRFKAIAVFGEGIVQLFNGEFKKGFKTLADSAIQWTTGFTNGTDKIVEGLAKVTEGMESAWVTGNKLVNLENAIEDAEVAITVARANNNVELEKQRDIWRDVNKENDVRLAAAQKEIELQDQMAAQEEALLKMKLQKLVIEQDMDKIMTDDEKLERAKMEADLIQLQATNLENKKKATMTLRNLEKEMAETAIKDARLVADLQIEAIAEQEEREVKALDEKFNRQIEDLTLKGEQRKEAEKLLEEIKLREIQEIRDKYATERNEKEEKDREKRLKDEQKEKDFKAKLELDQSNMKLDLLQKGTDMAAQSLAQQQTDEKQAKRIRKAAALVDIFIQLQKELAANRALAAANPLNATTGGAAGIAQATALNIRSRVNAAFAAAAVLAFGKGGIPSGVLRGRSHEQGGIPLVAEGDEIILTRGVYRHQGLRAMASAINVAGGGRSFALGGPVNPFSSSQPNNSQSPVSTTAPLMPTDPALLRKLDDIAAAMDRRIDRLKVHNNLSEVRDGIRLLNELEDEANI